MANIYDQFDEPEQQAGNLYDQFGEPEAALTGSLAVPFVDDTGVRAPSPRVAFDLGGTEFGAVQPEARQAATQAASIGAAVPAEPAAPEYARSTGQAMKEATAAVPLLAVGGGAFNAPTMLGKVGRGAVAGGGGGTLYGGAVAEGDIQNRLGNALETGAWGTAIGLVFPPVAKVVGSGGRLALDRLQAWFGGENTRIGIAARQTAERILKSNPDMSAEEALQRTREELVRLGDAGRLGDVSDELQGLTGAVARAGGRPAQTIKDRIRTRQEGTRNPETMELEGGQVGRTEEMLDTLSPENPRLLGKELAGQDATTRQFYGEAFAANQQMDSPVIRRLVKTPEGKRALKAATEAMGNETKLASKPDPELTAIYNELLDLGKISGKRTGVGVGRGFKLETLDLLKRELDSIARAGKSPSASDKAAARGRRAGVLAKRLRNELDRLDETARAGPKSTKLEGGEYAKARARAQQRIEARKALQSGEHFLLKSKYRNQDELKAVMDEMSPEERHAFRVNAAQTLKDMAAGTKATHDVTKKLKGDRSLEGKIKLAFGDPETFRRYMRFMDAEEQMFKTYSEVFRGSQTAERLAEDARMRVGPSGEEVVSMGASALRGDKVGLVAQVLRALVRTIRGVGTRVQMPENVRRELAEFLTGPDGIQKLERELRAGAQKAELSKESRAWLGRILLETERRGVGQEARAQ